MEFSADGRMISGRDADGNPVAWKMVAYEGVLGESKTLALQQVLVDSVDPVP